MRRAPLIAGLALALLVGSVAARPASAGGTGAVADNHARRAPVSARVAAALGPSGELRGMALNNSSSAALTLAPLDFPRLAAEGITSVTAYIYVYVDDPWSSTFSSGNLTPSDDTLRQVVQKARQNGLLVDFMPVVLDKTAHGFRGNYVPTDPAAFFRNYTQVLDHYADLAQETGVALFYVGSENNKITKFTSQWRSLIASVRRHYSGALTYMSTTYTGYDVKFWDALDLVAVSPYYSLGEEKVITYDRVMAAWDHDHLPYLASYARSVRKPLIFGEIGYRSNTLGYSHPSAPSGTLPAPTAQQIAYRALLDAIAKTPYVYGMTAWFWDPTSSPADVGFSPKGKPAECTLAQRWSTDQTVQRLASLPTCDLSVVDAVTQVPGL